MADKILENFLKTFLNFKKTPKTNCHLTLVMKYHKYLILAALFTKQIISQSKVLKQSNHVPV